MLGGHSRVTIWISADQSYTYKVACSNVISVTRCAIARKKWCVTHEWPLRSARLCVSIVTCETSLHLIALVNWWMI